MLTNKALTVAFWNAQRCGSCEELDGKEKLTDLQEERLERWRWFIGNIDGLMKPSDILILCEITSSGKDLPHVIPKHVTHSNLFSQYLPVPSESGVSPCSFLVIGKKKFEAKLVGGTLTKRPYVLVTVEGLKVAGCHIVSTFNQEKPDSRAKDEIQTNLDDLYPDQAVIGMIGDMNYPLEVAQDQTWRSPFSVVAARTDQTHQGGKVLDYMFLSKAFKAVPQSFPYAGSDFLTIDHAPIVFDIYWA